MSLLLSSSLFTSGNSSMANDIVQASENEYIIVGRIYNNDGYDSAFINRITAAGSIVWEKTYSSSFSQFFQSVTKLSNGYFVATGSFFYSEYAGDEYIWVVIFDAEGNIIWQSAFGNVGKQSDGYSIKSTKDGGFVIAGLSMEETSLTCVLKFDAKGKLQWSKKYNIGVAFSVAQTMDDGYVLVGRSNNCSEEESLENPPFILRIDTQGNIVWQKTYDDYQIYVLLKCDIIETSNGHFAIVAKTLIMEVDSCGNKIFAYNNEDFRLSTILQTSDNNYGIGGNLVVNYLEHAYIATLNRDSLINSNSSMDKIIWDNIDIVYNSSFNRIITDVNGWLVGCGYISNDPNLQSFFSVFDPNQNIF